MSLGKEEVRLGDCWWGQKRCTRSKGRKSAGDVRPGASRRREKERRIELHDLLQMNRTNITTQWPRVNWLSLRLRPSPASIVSLWERWRMWPSDKVLFVLVTGGHLSLSLSFSQEHRSQFTVVHVVIFHRQKHVCTYLLIIDAKRSSFFLSLTHCH